MYLYISSKLFMGKKKINTEAVEEIIDKHYSDQIEELESSGKKKIF